MSDRDRLIAAYRIAVGKATRPNVVRSPESQAKICACVDDLSKRLDNAGYWAEMEQFTNSKVA